MPLVAAMLVVGLVIGIAAVIVVREAGRLAKEPPLPVFDLQEAYEWVVAHVPDVVAATLTPEDVRRILDLQVEFFKRKGVSGNGSSGRPAGSVVIGGAETVEYIIERAAAARPEGSTVWRSPTAAPVLPGRGLVPPASSRGDDPISR